MDRKQKFAQLKFLRDSMNNGSMVLDGPVSMDGLMDELKD